jgi:hypothetical protein
MKKSLILGILGLAAVVASSYGQGVIWLDNYASSGPLLHAVGGVALLPTGYNIGLYYGPANVNAVGSVAADLTGYADPTTQYAGFNLATGTGSTAPSIGVGFFSASAAFLIQPLAGTVSVPYNSYTMELVAYNGATYDTSLVRGHSAPFYGMDGSSITPGVGEVSQLGLTSFSVVGVPEPTTLALGALGGLGLLLFRRKKA